VSCVNKIPSLVILLIYCKKKNFQMCFLRCWHEPCHHVDDIWNVKPCVCQENEVANKLLILCGINFFGLHVGAKSNSFIHCYSYMMTIWHVELTWIPIWCTMITCQEEVINI
jgi:hypothetical protein